MKDKNNSKQVVKPRKKGVGSLDFFCIGFGAIVGVGWAVSLNRWMASSGGPIPAAAGYLLALIIMVPIALCYCELCPMFPVAGGGMVYAKKAYGRKLAFLSGWAVLGAFITIIPWEAIYVVDTLSILIPGLKGGTALYHLAGTAIYPGHIIVGTLISFLLFFINRKGVSSSAGLQKILCIFLVGSGVLAMICAIPKIDLANFQPFYENVSHSSHHSFFGGAMSILATAPFFLAGFETIPQAVGDAGGEPKSAGKAVVLSVSLSCVFYALLLITLGGALPWKEFMQLNTPAASELFLRVYPGTTGKVLYTVILSGALCGLLTTWNGFMMASSQMIGALGKQHIIPEFFAKEHKVYKTPTRALTLCLIVSIAGPFLGMGLIDPLTSFSAAGYVVSWTITAFCLVKLRKSAPDAHRPYKVPGGKNMGRFSALTMSILLVLLFIPSNPAYMGTTAIKLFIAWLAIGVVVSKTSATMAKQAKEDYTADNAPSLSQGSNTKKWEEQH